MKNTGIRFFQAIVIIIVHAITLIVISKWITGIQIDSPRAAIGAAIAYTLAQMAFWFVFIKFLSWLPAILYPILTFVLGGFAVMIVANVLPGIEIDSWVTGLRITLWITIVNGFLSTFLSIDQDAIVDRVVTRRMVKKHGKVETTAVPGFVFLEIDGLGEGQLHKAIDEGFMPNLKGWLDRGSHIITGWETDYSAQTGAMQSGILLGNNNEIPAYRWWDRSEQHVVISGDPRDAIKIEKNLSTGRGLLADGGASRGNMFSGDAEESILTMSTVLNKERGRGPGFYFYLLSPTILLRLLARFFAECVIEWKDAWLQKRRKDPYRISARKRSYAFLRAFMGPFLQDLATYMVVSDMLRGLPAIYALYPAYDDLSHFAGMHSPEAFKSLHETDRYFARIEKALKFSPRPYHIVVLSDHGQTLGITFENAFGITLEKLVQSLLKGEGEVYAAQNTHETWDKLGAVLDESIQDDTRTAKLIDNMLKNKKEGDMVVVGPQAEDEKARKSKVVIFGSGGAGLIYFTHSPERMTFEEIQKESPDLIIGLYSHPGVDFVMVKSAENGNMVIGKGGIYYLDDDKVEGNRNPIGHYGPNAARHLRREASFSNCPDLLVNSVYDPEKDEMYNFENQVSHHGAMGGPQNFGFVLHPASLHAGDEPIVTAEGLYKVMRGWRDQAAA